MSVKRFERLLRIREVQENDAAVGLAGRLRELNTAEGQRDQLLHYQRLYVLADQPASARQLKQMAQVRSNLREAIEQQDLRIAAARTRVEQARAVWLERHQATLSLDKLIARRRASDLVLENRKLQREQDMWATRKVFDRKT